MAELVSVTARKIIRFNEKSVNNVNPLVHKPSVYGMVLKYFLYLRKIPFSRFGKALGITAQGVNHLLNRSSRVNFYDDDLENYCRLIGVDYGYFCELVDEVDKLQVSDGVFEG